MEGVSCQECIVKNIFQSFDRYNVYLLEKDLSHRKLIFSLVKIFYKRKKSSLLNK